MAAVFISSVILYYIFVFTLIFISVRPSYASPFFFLLVLLVLRLSVAYARHLKEIPARDINALVRRTR